MGYTSYSRDAYDNLKTSYVGKSTDDIFTSNKTRKISEDMSPLNLKVRESRDSDAHPQSLAIAIFLDETGSMGTIPEILVRKKLGPMMDILTQHGVKDAHVLFGGIGDHIYDRYPLQVGQFEAGADELTKWLTSLYLEHNGGGNSEESYLLAWLIAARHTSIDCFEKRGQKGFLFTIGDEANINSVPRDKMVSLLGYDPETEFTDKQLLVETQRMYHVFHIHVQQGSYKDDPAVLGYWRKMLKQNLIILDAYNDIAEVMAATVAAMLGGDLKNITDNLSSSTALAVKNAVSGLVELNTDIQQSGGVLNL